jgi:predicted MFS family arabinose efflux permease
MTGWCIPGHVVGWAVAGAMALCQFTDNFVFSFPLTFVPQQLEILDYSSADISVLVGAFAWANQLSFLLLTLYLCGAEPQAQGRVQLRQQLRMLLLAAFVHYTTTLTMAMFPNFEVMTACRFLQGSVSPVVSVYGLTVVAACFADTARALPIALVIAGSCGGELLGSFAGGYLFYLGGMRFPFYVCTGLAASNFLALLVALVVAVPAGGATPAPPRSENESLWAPLRTLLSDGFVLASCLVVFGAQATKTAVEVILPLFLQNQLGANEMAVSVFSGVLAVAFVLSSVLHGYLGDRQVVSPVQLIPVHCVLLGASGWAAVYWTDIRSIVLGLGVFGAALGGTLSPCCDALLQYCQRSLSTVSEPVAVAVFNDFWAAGLVLGAYLAGWPNEFDRVAQRSILAWAGLAMGVIAAAFAYVLPRASQRPKNRLA